MLKKCSLLFIKYSSILIGINVLLQLILPYFTYSYYITDIIDKCTTIIITLGFVLLSFTFKFCIYHRLLLYCGIICHILFIPRFDIFTQSIIYFFSIIIIILIIIIIYKYFKIKK